MDRSYQQLDTDYPWFTVAVSAADWADIETDRFRRLGLVLGDTHNTPHKTLKKF